MKSAKVCPLIVVLGLKSTPRSLISMIQFIILPLAYRFSTMVLNRYSFNTTMEKD